MKTLRLPLVLFAAPALLVRFSPERTTSLLLDRAAVFPGGIWRLWTGHWVHFSLSHLGWNLAVLLAAGAWLQHTRPGWLLRHTLVAAPLISLALLAVEPAMAGYGGLSALATSVVTLLALEQMSAGRADRPLWAALLLLVGGKALYDTGLSSALFSHFDVPAIRLSRFAHLSGALVALGLWPAWRRQPWKMTPPGSVTDSRREGSGAYP